jgi:hypothetical protein
LQGEGEVSLLLDLDALVGTLLALDSLDDVARLGMLDDAVDLAKPAADADVFFGVNPDHGSPHLRSAI